MAIEYLSGNRATGTSSDRTGLTTYSAKFKNVGTEHYLFPDAVALIEENKIINDYILPIQKEVGLEPKYLTFEEVDKIKNMEAEKYRRDLV